MSVLGIEPAAAVITPLTVCSGPESPRAPMTIATTRVMPRRSQKAMTHGSATGLVRLLRKRVKWAPA